MKKVFVAVFAMLLFCSKSNATEVGTWAEFQAAVEDTSETSITVTDNITRISGSTLVRNPSNKLTIDLNGYTIDGNTSTMLENNSDTTISNGTINNCETAISSSKNLTIDNVKFYENNAESPHGGAINYDSADGTSTIRNTIFDKNIASDTGGAIYSRKNLHIYNSVFTNNSTKNGGAIAAEVGYILNIYNSTFKNNSVTADGGAIFATGNLEIENSVFNSNNAKNGGAIYFQNNSFVGSIKNSCFSGNHIGGENARGGALYINGNFNIFDSIFDGNLAVHGGAIYFIGLGATDTTLSIYNSIFKNNNAIDGKGGAITIGNTTGKSTVRIIGNNGYSLFKENRIAASLNSIYLLDSNSNLELNAGNSSTIGAGYIQFDDNIAGMLNGNAGNIYINKATTGLPTDGTVFMNNDIFDSNVTIENGMLYMGRKDNLNDAKISYRIDPHSGNHTNMALTLNGGILNLANGIVSEAVKANVINATTNARVWIDVDLANSNMDKLTADMTYPAVDTIYINTLRILTEISPTTISNINNSYKFAEFTYTNNNKYQITKNPSGNAVTFTATAQEKSLETAIASNGERSFSLTADYDLQSSNSEGSDGKLTGTTFTIFGNLKDALATKDVVKTTSNALYGTSVYKIDGTTNNYYLLNSMNSGQTFNIVDAYILNMQKGGSELLRNGNGGFVENNGGTVNVYNSYIERNKAVDNNTITGMGGAFYNNLGTINLYNSTLKLNDAISNSGGAIANVDNATVNSFNSVFETNLADNGAAIFNHTGAFANIYNTSFSENRSLSKGGAIYNDSSTLNINNSSFISNGINSRNSGAGGAIYSIGSSSVVNINNSSFISNYINSENSADGGAISNDNSTINIYNTSFKNNKALSSTAGSYGGAIANKAGTVNIIAQGLATIDASKKDIVFEGNKVGNVLNQKNNAIYNNATLNLNAAGMAENSGIILFNDAITQTSSATMNINATHDVVTGVPTGAPTTGAVVFNSDMSGIDGTVNLYNGTLAVIANSTLFNNNTNFNIYNTPNLNLQSANTGIYNLGKLTLNSNLNVGIKADLANKAMTSLSASTYTTTNPTHSIDVNSINIASNSKETETIVNFIDTTSSTVNSNMASAVNYKGGSKINSNIYSYDVSYDKNTGNFKFIGGGDRYGGYNPSIMASSVASQLGGYLTQLESYDQGFHSMDNFMNLTKAQRLAIRDRNKYAISDTQKGNPTYTASAEKSGWFNPYASFEKVGLDNGPDVDAITYGSYFGGNSELHELKQGWLGQYGVYAGYNGAYQSYDGINMNQNGATIGASGTLYKGNFFTGLTANVGGSAGQAYTAFGTDNFAMLMSGVASKTGYNLEMKEGKFILQPNLLMAYSFINTFNYTNAAGVDITSDPLHALTIEPGIKFIANLKNGWQPYLGVSMVWNIMDKSKFCANDISLPEMSIRPFVQYGIGIQKRSGDRFTGYAQAMLRGGGRNGIGLSFGFRWALGKNTAKL